MTALKVILYASCMATCLACTVLLVRKYLEQRTRLLLWSAVCFVCLSLNNALLVLDLLILPAVDLRLARLGVAAIGMTFLIGGFIRELRK